jgi:hypothetical protein
VSAPDPIEAAISAAMDASRRDIPPGSAGTALTALVNKGLMVRKGIRYVLPEHAEEA